MRVCLLLLACCAGIASAADLVDELRAIERLDCRVNLRHGRFHGYAGQATDGTRLVLDLTAGEGEGALVSFPDTHHASRPELDLDHVAPIADEVEEHGRDRATRVVVFAGPRPGDSGITDRLVVRMVRNPRVGFRAEVSLAGSDDDGFVHSILRAWRQGSGPVVRQREDSPLRDLRTFDLRTREWIGNFHTFMPAIEEGTAVRVDLDRIGEPGLFRFTGTDVTQWLDLSHLELRRDVTVPSHRGRAWDRTVILAGRKEGTPHRVTLALHIQYDLRTGADGEYPEVSTGLILRKTHVEAGYITSSARAHHRGPPPGREAETGE